MRRHWAIPIVFGILFFSTVFSAQDVYGPHFTTLDGLRYDFQGFGVDSFFDIIVELSDGHANPKKKADFELCVHLIGARDTTVQTEIVALSLVSCEPIHIGPSDRKGFQLFQFRIQTDGPIETSSMIADISGFIELRNPGGQSTGGVTDFVAEDVVLGPLVCVPPSCEGQNDCHGHGVCVADDTCVCEKGWSDEDCSVPQCDGTTPCPDDGDPCTISVCHENQCAIAVIPGCIPDNSCRTSADCDDGNQCTLNVCDSVGQCSNPPLPGGTSCDDGVFCSGEDVCDGDGNCRAGAPTCGEGNTCDEDGEKCQCNIVIDCAVGFIPADTDGDGCPDACIPSGDPCAGVNCDDGNSCTIDACDPDTGVCSNAPQPGACDDGDACSVNDSCNATGECEGIPQVCDDGNLCTVGSCDTATGGCTFTDIVCEKGLVCDPSTGACTPTDLCAGVSCTDFNECTDDLCDPLTGACSNPPLPRDTACTDQRFCTQNDVCDGDGTCVGGSPTDCSALDDVCMIGVCDESISSCIQRVLPDGTPCESSSGDGVCSAGICQVKSSADIWVIEKRYLGLDPTGTTGTYRVDITNRGPSTALDLQMEEQLFVVTGAAGIISVTDVTGDPILLECAISPPDQFVTANCPLGDLPNGGRIVLSIEIFPLIGEIEFLDNTVIVRSSITPDPNLNNNVFRTTDAPRI